MDGCRVGVGRARITPAVEGATLGWGRPGRKNAAPASDAADELYVTALALEDRSGQRLLLLNADLHCGGPVLWRAASDAAGLASGRVILCGTHTHEGPGQRYGGAMYSLFGSAAPSTVRASTKRLTPLIGVAAADAMRDLRPGGVGVVRADVCGVASNRATPAWSHYDDDERSSFVTGGPGASQAEAAHEADRLRDPRVTALVATSDDGRTRCVLAWYAVHGTALGAPWPTFSADLWGVAREVAQAELSQTAVGFGGGSSGDISPLPLDPTGEIRPDADRPSEQGRALADVVGTTIGEATASIAATASPVPFSLATGHVMWKPSRSSLPEPHVGMATAGGGVDGPLELHDEVKAGVDAPLYRSRRSRAFAADSGQAPKLSIAAAYTSAPLPLGLAFRVLAPKQLPLHVMRIGDHTFATVPGEPTTMAGWRIEQAVREASGTSSASVIGFAGDYAGYWVTAEEYLEQRYEAASTLFGRDATAALTAELVQLARNVRADRRS